MSLHSLCSWMITLDFRICVAKAYFVGTCHKDIEQISSILSVELIFNILYIYIYIYIYIIATCSGLVDAMAAAYH